MTGLPRDVEGWHAAVIVLELGEDARFGIEGIAEGHDTVIPAEDVTWARKRWTGRQAGQEGAQGAGRSGCRGRCGHGPRHDQ